MKNQIKYIDDLDDALLWNSLKAGDEKSFSILFKKYYETLIRYGNSFFPFTEKVEDCVQDVFTDVWVYRNIIK